MLTSHPSCTPVPGDSPDLRLAQAVYAARRRLAYAIDARERAGEYTMARAIEQLEEARTELARAERAAALEGVEVD